MLHSPLPLLLALALAAAAGRPREELPARTARQEHFLLEEVQLRGDGARDPLAADLAGRPLGVAVLRRTEQGAAVQLEWDLEFHDGHRILHVERRDASGVHLTWRELGGAQPRTLRIEWPSENDAGRMLEWSGKDRSTRSVAPAAQMLLPLELLERLRSPAGAELLRVELFDPLARAAAWVDVRWSAGPQGQRLAELRRDDGTCAGRYRFAAGELSGVQWQAGNLRARRIDGVEHARLRAERAAAARGEPDAGAVQEKRQSRTGNAAAR